MGLFSASSSRGVGPSTVVQLSAAFDIHAVGTHALLWNQILDNIYDGNVVGALPAGLGLTTPADGSSALITATVAGTWAFSLAATGVGADAAIRGRLTENFGGAAQPFGPSQASGVLGHLSTCYQLPSGAAAAFSIVTEIAATSGTYSAIAHLSITRLA